MTEEKIILSSPYFYSFLVIPVFFSSPLSFPCLARESKRDVRLKAEHDGKEKEDEHDIEKAPQMRGWENLLLFGKFIRVAQNITASPDGFDIILAAGGFFQFFAQFADENVDDFQFGLVNAAVQMV